MTTLYCLSQEQLIELAKLLHNYPADEPTMFIPENCEIDSKLKRAAPVLFSACKAVLAAMRDEDGAFLRLGPREHTMLWQAVHDAMPE